MYKNALHNGSFIEEGAIFQTVESIQLPAFLDADPDLP